MLISVVIPVFRGEKTIYRLFNEIKRSLEGAYEYEVIFICDGGTDNSWEIIKNLHKQFKGNVSAYRLNHNYGQHKALLYGLKQAKGDIVITMDEDLQHDPADIPELVDTLVKGRYDLVYARFNEIKNTRPRILFSKLFRILFRRFIPYLNINYSPFRAMTGTIASKAAHIKDVYIFIDAFLSKLTSNSGILELSHHESQSGVSSYTYRNLIQQTFYIILAYSRFVLYSIMSASILILFYLALLLFEPGPDVARIWLSKILLISGIILLCVGSIGEYINRYNLRISSREIYVDEILD